MEKTLYSLGGQLSDYVTPLSIDDECVSLMMALFFFKFCINLRLSKSCEIKFLNL